MAVVRQYGTILPSYVAYDAASHTDRSLDEVKHVAFLKVHKTGSSSVQNIFIRFGDSRNLTFILASVKHNECDGFTNCISLKNSLTDTNIVPPPIGRHFQVLCTHVIYNQVQFAKYLPRDTRYIGLVREPVRRLESAIGYFDLLHRVNLTDFVQDPTKYTHPMINNRMALEFGFEKSWFPTTSHRHLTLKELKEVYEYMHTIKHDFHLILVTERLDESLVLMKRMLGWKTRDIIYHKKLTTSMKKIRRFSVTDRKKLSSYLYLDTILYTFAVSELERKIAEAGHDFIKEVNNFKTLRQSVEDFCKNISNSKVKTMAVDGNAWFTTFNVNATFCNKLLMAEIPYLEQMRLKQYGTLDTL